MAVYGGYSVSTEASWLGSRRRVRGCWRLETPVSFCARGGSESSRPSSSSATGHLTLTADIVSRIRNDNMGRTTKGGSDSDTLRFCTITAGMSNDAWRLSYSTSRLQTLFNSGVDYRSQCKLPPLYSHWPCGHSFRTASRVELCAVLGLAIRVDAGPIC